MLLSKGAACTSTCLHNRDSSRNAHAWSEDEGAKLWQHAAAVLLQHAWKRPSGSLSVYEQQTAVGAADTAKQHTAAQQTATPHAPWVAEHPAAEPAPPLNLW